MALAPLFPLVPWFWPLLLLQLINGAAVSFAWSGAQTLIAQLADGDARYLGRFTFFARLGSTTAPILAGAVWDFGGVWPAYLVGTAWGGVLTIALLRAPEAEFFAPPRHDGISRARFRARDAWPRVSDYLSSIMLIAIPAIALSVAIMAMRNTTCSIQTSVYVVSNRGCAVPVCGDDRDRRGGVLVPRGFGPCPRSRGRRRRRSPAERAG
jgi:MFS family permease